MSNKAGKDNWEKHWQAFAGSAQKNPAQAYRRRFIFSRLSLGKTKAPVRLLDVGSGQGDLVLAIKTRFPQAEILGVELSKAGIEIARKKLAQAMFIQQDLLHYQTPPAGFRSWATHAVCAEVLERVDRPEQILKNIKSYLAPGSKLVITVPGGPITAYDKHIGHRRHYSRRNLRQVVQQAGGYRIRSVVAAGFPWFNLYRLVVLARGEKLVQDMDTHKNTRLQFVAYVIMNIFFLLFHFNCNFWGWQIIALVEKE
jgi:trans-aconitate methyltransferase